MEEKRGGKLKTILLVILVLGIIGSLGKSCKSSPRSHYSSSSYSSGSYSSSARRPTSTLKPASDQFGDDAEELLKDAKSSFGDEAAVSWTVNGKKATLTVRINDISSDDIAEWFRADPAWAQDMIDDLADSMKSANKSSYDALKNKGHSGFSVVFEMQTSDYFTVCTASNGSLTYKMTQENFKYG